MRKWEGIEATIKIYAETGKRTATHTHFFIFVFTSSQNHRVVHNVTGTICIFRGLITWAGLEAEEADTDMGLACAGYSCICWWSQSFSVWWASCGNRFDACIKGDAEWILQRRSRPFAASPPTPREVEGFLHDNRKDLVNRTKPFPVYPYVLWFGWDLCKRGLLYLSPFVLNLYARNRLDLLTHEIK